MRTLFITIVGAGLLTACTLSRPAPATQKEQALGTSAATAVGTVDCGKSDLRPPDEYDAGAQQCFWTAYSAGRSAQWSVMRYTTEGDPTPASLTFANGVLMVTRDMTRDRYSNEAGRRVFTWRCTTFQQHAWPANPQRYFFELGNCSGDAATTSFP